MKTVNEVFGALRNAPKKYAALKTLIDQGFGDCILMQYVGTAYATNKTSNAYKAREYWADKGYEVVGECAGARRQTKTMGHVVYIALKKTGVIS